MLPLFFAALLGFALLKISRSKPDAGDAGPTIEPPPTPKITKLGLGQDAVARASGVAGDDWIYLTAQKADGDHDMAWFYFGLTSPLYVHVSASRSGVRRGKWMKARDLFPDPRSDFVDLRKAKTSEPAGYSHLNVLAEAPPPGSGQLFIDMDRNGVATLSSPTLPGTEASLREMVQRTIPDVSGLL